MKRLFAIAAVVLLFPAADVSAQELWRLERFRADIEIRTDGVMEVRETVSAEFLTDRHGIFRYVPERGKDEDGRDVRIDARLVSVTRGGKPERVEKYRENGNVVWKIGKAEVTIRGKHEYVITYEVRGAIGRFEEHDELYWNVTGHGWDVPLPVPVATVMLPEDVSATGSACYVGPYGSEDPCQIVAAEDQIGFIGKEGEALTVVVGWPKGEVAVASVGILRKLLDALAAYGFAIAWLLPIAAAFLMYRTWKRSGEDPDLGAIVVQYGPPEGFSPAETHAIIARSSDRSDLAPTVIDLAARGFLRLTELPGDDYLLESLQPRESWKALKPFEQELLDGMFPGETIASRKLSELKERFYRHVTRFRNGIMDGLIADGHFPSRAGTSVGGWIALGATLIVAGFMTGSFSARGYAFPLMAAGLVVAGFGSQMGRWTEKGAATAAHALGFKEFIAKVEKYRAPWLEERGMIERLLPYAIAFGLGGKWVATFAPLLQSPPDWYRGASVEAWASGRFDERLSRFGQTFTRVAISRPPPPPPTFSSGSGLRSRSGGGGGFSGGGRGGGGGGSW